MFQFKLRLYTHWPHPDVVHSQKTWTSWQTRTRPTENITPPDFSCCYCFLTSCVSILSYLFYNDNFFFFFHQHADLIWHTDKSSSSFAWNWGMSFFFSPSDFIWFHGHHLNIETLFKYICDTELASGIKVRRWCSDRDVILLKMLTCCCVMGWPVLKLCAQWLSALLLIQ